MGSSTPGFPVLHYIWSLLKLMSIELVMPSNHLILCHPLLLLPSIFARNETPVQSLGWEHLLEKEMATPSSSVA